MHHVLRWLAMLMIRVFYRGIGVTGRERLPSGGPVVVVSNHPNGLIDPLVAQVALKRKLSFLAKSTFWGNPIGRLAMRAFDAIPVYRHVDGADTSRNEDTFRLARELLARGGWLMLFPEGVSHSEPRMRPLKTGAARIALTAEAQSGFRLGIRIAPLGLQYEDKGVFRTRAAAAVGEPIALSAYAQRWAEDERACVEALTRDIDRALGDVVLQADSAELWNGLVSVAAWTSPDGGRDFAKVEERARRLAEAYRRLSAEEPVRAAALVTRIRRYARALRSIGVDPFALGEVPSAGRIGWALLELALLAPFALAGTLLAWIPYRLTGVLASRTKDSDLVGTVKGASSMVLFPLTYALEAALAGALFGGAAAVATLVLAPLLSWAALVFQERVSMRRELLRGWWLRTNRARLVEVLQARRSDIARFVEGELEGDPVRRTGSLPR